MVLLTCSRRCDADYAYWVYHSGLIVKQVPDATNTTSQPALGIQRIRKFLVPWPMSTEEGDHIVNRLESVDRAIRTESAGLAKARILKQGLMHDLLTGRVSVKVP